MSTPRVSVVIATIPPRADLLRRALASVDAQTRRPDEIVVQLDEQGVGAGPTRNAAIARASGDYVAVLDDDDELLPPHVELLVDAAEAASADVAYSWFELWEAGRRVDDLHLATMSGGSLVHPLGVPFGAEQADHLRSYAWISACLMLRRDAVLDVGGYPAPGDDETISHGGCEDWCLLLRVLEAGGRFVHVPERTWRLHKGRGDPGAHETGTHGQPWRGRLVDPTR